MPRHSHYFSATLIEPSGEITPHVLEALPKPDVETDAAFTRLTYAHRSWQDADMDLFFKLKATGPNRAQSPLPLRDEGRRKPGTWVLARFVLIRFRALPRRAIPFASR